MPENIDIHTIESKIKEFALHLGFDDCGISKARFLQEENENLQYWLDNNFHAEMNYMSRNIDKRLNPQLLHEGTLSLISLLTNYYPEKKLNENENFLIAKYAYGTDYHFVIKEKLLKLIDYLKELFPESNPRAFVDSAPILERAWAKNAGLGWIGKNSLLLNKKMGSFFFISEILIDIELKPNLSVQKSYCGTCTKCIDACPTQAIIQPYVVDSEKCISYQTIESKQELPEGFIEKSGNWIFGCDICQDVCPWNKNPISAKVEELFPSQELLNFKREDWRTLEKSDFNKIFKSSPLQRAGFKKVKGVIDGIKE